MTSVYINFANPHFATTRTRADERWRNEKFQRLIRLAPDTFSTEIAPFIAQKVEFSSAGANSEMWLEIDFGDSLFELAIGKLVQRLIGRKYDVFLTAPWK